MQQQDVRNAWVQIAQAEEEAFKPKPKKPKVEIPQPPALPLKIDHKGAKWYLEEFLGINEENGEKMIKETPLGSKISVFFAKVYGITTVFNEDGKLVLKSQIYNLKERNKALVLFSLNNQFTGELLVKALENLEDSQLTIINAWLSPVVITTTDKQIHKAVWEIKKTALRNLINYMKQNDMPTVVGRELFFGLTKKKEGVRVWCEPVVDDKTQPPKRVEEVSEDVLKLAFELLSEFEQYKAKFNSLTFKQDDDDIPLEL
jgi:hypothetical protein